MSIHNICFHEEIRKIFTGYPPLSRTMEVPPRQPAIVLYRRINPDKIFFLFLHDNRCCRYSLEALLMSTHNIIFDVELRKHQWG